MQEDGSKQIKVINHCKTHTSGDIPSRVYYHWQVNMGMYFLFYWAHKASLHQPSRFTTPFCFHCRRLYKQECDPKCDHNTVQGLSGFDAKQTSKPASLHLRLALLHTALTRTVTAHIEWRDELHACSADWSNQPTNPTQNTSHAWILCPPSDLTWEGCKLLRACPWCVALPSNPINPPIFFSPCSFKNFLSPCGMVACTAYCFQLAHLLHRW